MHKKMCVIIVISITLFAKSIIAQVNINGGLTIHEAVKKGLENNYELQILNKLIETSKAEKRQNSLYQNPEFEIEAENILGNDDLRGFSGSEITTTISQNIQLGGKISSKGKISEINISLAEWDYETKKLDVITSIRKSFIQVLTIKKLVEKNSELAKISTELLNNLIQRVKVGKISPAEVSRAKIIMNNLETEIASLKSDYEYSLFELATLINESNLFIEKLNGELKMIDEIVEYDSLSKKLKNNLNLKRFEIEFEKQNAILAYEESASIPDLRISAGYKRHNEINANTFLVGASIPLPIFNRNQGALQMAKIGIDKKRIEYEYTKQRLTLKLNLLYNKLKMLLNSSKRLKNESILNAEEAFRIIKEGNIVGRFTILDVLDAERTLFELENQYLIIQGDINLLLIEIDGLTMSTEN